jgi:high affinity sulfate transporter 1
LTDQPAIAPTPPLTQRRQRESLLPRIAPGLSKLLGYKFGRDFRFDLVAGVSVAAVALPVAVAYAELAGFPPEVGLYSSILPLVAYAIFGTSPQLMVNPDAAACAMIAASVAPLAGSDQHLYASLSIAMTFLAGLLCIVASFARLGALADFLSKPILVGFMNGISISIFLGQLGKILGFAVKSGGIVPRVMEIASKLPQTHMWTLIVGLASCAVLMLCKRFVPRAPGALIVMILAGIAVALFKLDTDPYHVAILGKVPAGLPRLSLPRFPLHDLPQISAEAAGLALVLFSSGMLTGRSFASKNGYDLDADQEFAAIGVANIASAVSRGFAVTGADSRTAMADASGGKTQVTGIIAAATIAAVLLFFTSPLQYVPTPALGAVLIVASFSLFDVRTLRQFWAIDRTEVILAIITTIGVIAVGAINAILVAVAIAVARFVKRMARPTDEILGTVDGLAGFHSIERHPQAKTYPGLVMYRFGSPLTFFNCAYFKRRVLAAADAAGAGLRWVILDVIPIVNIDVTGLLTMREVRLLLEARGVTLVIAGRKTEYINWLKSTGLYRDEMDQTMFLTLRQAFRAFEKSREVGATTATAAAAPSRSSGTPGEGRGGGSSSSSVSN